MVDRMPGHNDGQLYSYPARRWRKKRRQYLMNDNYLTRRNPQNEITSEELATISVDNSSRMDVSVENFDKFIEESKESWLKDFDDGSDLPDAGELDDPESDYDDYEEYSTRKKKKKKDAPKRKRVEYSDAEKPYACDLCGARYKTRPGLSYHYSHSHQNDNSNGSSNSMPGPNNGRSHMEEEDMPYTPPRQMHHQSHPGHPSQSTPVTHPPPNMPPGPHSMPQMMPSQMMPSQHSSGAPPPVPQKMPNNEENEGLISFSF